jgi:hypothetical protein
VEWLPSITSILISVIAGGCAGWAIANTRRLRRLADLAGESAEVAFDMLEAMERAHDPGRDVHQRFAAALEARLIATEGPTVEPARRRTVAMAMAGDMIEAIRRADLELSVRVRLDDG